MLDKDIFYAMIEENYSKLLKWCNKLTCNREDGSDLANDTVVKAIENRDKYVDNNMKNWLFTIAKNLYLNKEERDCNEKKVIKDFCFETLVNKDYTPFNQPISMVDTYYEILNQLSEKHRQILIDIESGLKYEEIAKKHDIPLGTVKSRIYYAKIAIAKLLSRMN